MSWAGRYHRSSLLLSTEQEDKKNPNSQYFLGEEKFICASGTPTSPGLPKELASDLSVQECKDLAQSSYGGEQKR